MGMKTDQPQIELWLGMRRDQPQVGEEGPATGCFVAGFEDRPATGWLVAGLARA